MKIAYIIVAHKNPKLIKKMVNFLTSDKSSFFIHIDKKSNIYEFKKIAGDNVFFSNERIPVYWSEYSMVEATLLMIQQVLAAQQHYDYLVLLSGSDYPIKSKEYIHNFLSLNGKTEYISSIKIPSEGAGIPLSKINILRIRSEKPVPRFILRVFAKLGMAQRDYKKFLGSMEPYGGSTWWMLTQEACQYILDFVKNNPHICKYFEGTFCPDETVFHTILSNSIFKSRIKRNVLYDDWYRQGAHPELINENHLDFLGKKEKIIFKDDFGTGEMLFARKFSDDNLEVIEKLEKMICTQ